MTNLGHSGSPRTPPSSLLGWAYVYAFRYLLEGFFAILMKIANHFKSILFYQKMPQSTFSILVLFNSLTL